MTLLKALLRLLLKPALYLAALFTLLEEWLWDHLKALAAAIGRLPVLRQIEAGLRRAPPWLALLVLLTPGVVLFPAKLGGLWLISHGRILLGGTVFLLAKLVGMAMLSRLYALLRPALVQLRLFCVVERWVLDLVAWAHAWINAQPVYQQARRRLAQFKTLLRAYWRQLKAQVKALFGGTGNRG